MLQRRQWGRKGPDSSTSTPTLREECSTARKTTKSEQSTRCSSSRWVSWAGGVLLGATVFLLCVICLPSHETVPFGGQISSTIARTPYASTSEASSTLPGEEKECTVWIAPSSLRGVNGYGIFTTRDIRKGESILGAPDGVGIPVGSYHYNEEPKARERRLWRKRKFLNFHQASILLVSDRFQLLILNRSLLSFHFRKFSITTGGAAAFRITSRTRPRPTSWTIRSVSEASRTTTACSTT